MKREYKPSQMGIVTYAAEDRMCAALSGLNAMGDELLVNNKDNEAEADQNWNTFLIASNYKY